VFFRANKLGDAWYVISNWFYSIKGLRSALLLSNGITEFVILFFACLLFFTISLAVKSKYITEHIIDKPFIRWFCYCLFVCLLVLFHVPEIMTQFLYVAF